MRPDPLADLLEEERRLILSGTWAGLQALAPRKERGLATLGTGDAARIGLLAAALARNQALLRAALDGLRDAAQRRATLASSRAGLVTYDARGARAELPLAPPRIERKA